MKNNIRTSFTFNECLQSFCGTSEKFITSIDSKIASKLGTKFEQDQTYLINNFENVLYTSGGVLKFQLNAIKILKGIYNKYRLQNFASIEKPYLPWDRQISDISDSDVQDEINARMYLLIDYLDKIYPKYDKLLSLYATKQGDLMNALSNKVVANAKTSGTSRFNDTPQDTGTFDDDTHTTNITESSSSSNSGQTTTYDDKNVMERLDEVQKLYDNLLRRAIGEFEKFFWEE